MEIHGFSLLNNAILLFSLFFSPHEAVWGGNAPWPDQTVLINNNSYLELT